VPHGKIEKCLSNFGQDKLKNVLDILLIDTQKLFLTPLVPKKPWHLLCLRSARRKETPFKTTKNEKVVTRI